METPAGGSGWALVAVTPNKDHVHVFLNGDLNSDASPWAGAAGRQLQVESWTTRFTLTCMSSEVCVISVCKFELYQSELWPKSVVLSLVGGAEPHQFHTGNHRTLFYWKIKLVFFKWTLTSLRWKNKPTQWTHNKWHLFTETWTVFNATTLNWF